MQIRDGLYPPCPDCGAQTTWTPRKLVTDMHEPQWNEALGDYVSSGREALRRLRERGAPALERKGFKVGDFIEAGDKVGGAREEPWSGARHRQQPPLRPRKEAL